MLKGSPPQQLTRTAGPCHVNLVIPLLLISRCPCNDPGDECSLRTIPYVA